MVRDAYYDAYPDGNLPARRFGWTLPPNHRDLSTDPDETQAPASTGISSVDAGIWEQLVDESDYEGAAALITSIAAREISS